MTSSDIPPWADAEEEYSAILNYIAVISAGPGQWKRARRLLNEETLFVYIQAKRGETVGLVSLMTHRVIREEWLHPHYQIRSERKRA